MEYNDRIDVQLDDNHTIENIDLFVRNLTKHLKQDYGKNIQFLLE